MQGLEYIFSSVYMGITKSSGDIIINTYSTFYTVISGVIIIMDACTHDFS